MDPRIEEWWMDSLNPQCNHSMIVGVVCLFDIWSTTSMYEASVSGGYGGLTP